MFIRALRLFLYFRFLLFAEIAALFSPKLPTSLCQALVQQSQGCQQILWELKGTAGTKATVKAPRLLPSPGSRAIRVCTAIAVKLPEWLQLLLTSTATHSGTQKLEFLQGLEGQGEKKHTAQLACNGTVFFSVRPWCSEHLSVFTRLWAILHFFKSFFFRIVCQRSAFSW